MDPDSLELAWLLDTECQAVLARVAKLLADCAEDLEVDEDAKPEAVRGGEIDEGRGMHFSAALNGRRIEALQVQLALPELDREAPER